MTPLLRSELYDVLVRGLDEAVEADPSLDTARRQLLLPVQLLDALAAQTAGTLADDALAMQRLRHLLTSAGTHALPPSAASALSESVSAPAPRTSSRATRRTSAKAAAPMAKVPTFAPLTPPPGLLHLGWLVLVGLAADRVGKLLRMDQALVDTVHGLALATGPAEALASAVAAGLSREHVQVLLAALASPRAQETPSSGLTQAIAGFLTDPAQRARWACIAHLFELLLGDTRRTHWEGASAEGIAALRPRTACPSEPVQLLGLFTEALVTALRPDTTGAPAARQVLFASPGEPLPLPARFIEARPGGLQGPDQQPLYDMLLVEVPEGARPGWVGFTDPEAWKRASTERKRLKELWHQRNEADACLAEMPVPLEYLAALPASPLPPLLGPNVFSGGRPRFLAASLTPLYVAPGEALVLEWATEGSQAVDLWTSGQAAPGEDTRLLEATKDLPPSGRLRLVPAAGQQQVQVTLTAANACATEQVELASHVLARIQALSAHPPGRPGDVLVEGEPFEVHVELTSQPADVLGMLQVGQETFTAERTASGGLTFQLPGSLATSALSGTVWVGTHRGTLVHDSRPLGALAFQAPGRVVVLRLAVLECDASGCQARRLTRREAEAALLAAQRQLGLALRAQEAFWLDDASLVTGPVDGSDAPGVERLLERLARLAALHPGYEDATWVALVPGQAHVARHTSAEAAARVAVATAAHLAEVLAVQPPSPPPASRVLRLVGTLGGESSLTLERAREEVRARGAGAPVDSKLVVVGLDARGQELATQPLRTTRALGTRGFVALLPVSEDTVRVEVRSARDVLHRLPRPPGTPRLEQVALAGEALSWQPQHSHAARCHGTVELRVEDGWCPVALVGPCETTLTLSTHRLVDYGGTGQHEARLRLVLTDGWNTTEALVPTGLLVHPPHVALRDAGEGRFWADAEDGALPRWTLGSRTVEASALRVLPGEYGTLSLEVGGVRQTTPVGEPPDAHHCH